MIVARLKDGHLDVVDRMREGVMLGAGLDERGLLTTEAQDRAVACLERFGQRVREVPAGRVRAVGTNTLRRAKNGLDFLERAQVALGHPIEIIAGKEEARLIYLGMAQTAAHDEGRRLVVDIGGGSTECVIGQGFDILQSDSLFMGCVSVSLEFFGDGVLTKERFQRASIAAKLEAQSIESAFRSLGWQQALGCSGTILSIDDILHANGWGDLITAKGLKRFRKAMIMHGHTRALDLLGVPAERRAIIPGGLAILEAIFETLGIEVMRRSPGALREGLLYDLVGRIRHEDTRDRTIRGFCSRYGVDRRQSERVERTARWILEGVAGPWRLDMSRALQVLTWAAQLHEIGLSISHTGYHKHSAYLVTYADMAGFSREDQRLLAAVILAHRRKIRRDVFAGIARAEVETAMRLAAVFRLACALNRTRSTEALPDASVTADSRCLRIEFPAEWLRANPLTSADLQQHRQALSNIGIDLDVRTRIEDAVR
ncbi:MAG: Ppx/GppA family phosphatase [Deltaproteobacteria bacterium]|nr:Ppx/GppA family phosphatase [Deltaproteobacteria bacterium]